MAFSYEFRQALGECLNKHSIDGECQTPDFILADMLVDFLQIFATTMSKREDWYGRESSIARAINIEEDPNATS